MSIPNDWRYKDEKFQLRQFLLSSFVRSKIPLSKNVYEFCDFTISQGWITPTHGLEKIDIQLIKMYNTYLETINK